MQVPYSSTSPELRAQRSVHTTRLIITASAAALVLLYAGISFSIWQSDKKILSESLLHKNMEFLPIALAPSSRVNFTSKSEGFSVWFPGESVEHSTIELDDHSILHSYIATNKHVIYWLLSKFRIGKNETVKQVEEGLWPEHINDHWCDAPMNNSDVPSSGPGWSGHVVSLRSNFCPKDTAAALQFAKPENSSAFITMFVINGTPAEEKEFFASLRANPAGRTENTPILSYAENQPANQTTMTVRKLITEVVHATSKPVRKLTHDWIYFMVTLCGPVFLMLLIVCGLVSILWIGLKNIFSSIAAARRNSTSD